MATDIPNQMKALRIHGVGEKYYKLEQVDVPSPKGYEALIKVGAAGLCHTDMMLFTGEFKTDKYPLIGSHEPAGTVVALGEDAKGTVKIGQRVAGMLHRDVCGECTDCKAGLPKYCPNSLYTGITTNGAFAEYEILDARYLAPIPDEMSFEQAAPMTCAGITIYTAIKKAKLKPGQILAISGLGALGHLGVQMAKAMGLTVVGIDARPEPIAMTEGLRLAPDLCIDATSLKAEEAVEEIHKLRPKGYEGWKGADATILTSDPLSAQRYAMDITRRHGTYVVVSQPDDLRFTYQDIIFKDLTIIGSLHGWTEDLKECLDLAAKHGIKSELSCYKLDKHEEMVDSVHDSKRKGKSVLVF
ncbi:chaperonin 10-like protein [Kockovaella imperatae]|uniref:Chaperonin 10-like protein n=1 Tax=Kockovaella imperatae TaxID=4999 RepID=A0A1Y1UNM5_9TREE|nr:chaperonin 10-like protein [Kockovaella imperatae]ORX39094.1 chaperonin 10-like protein [Kockovaella imperatae]